MDNSGKNVHETKKKLKEKGIIVELTSPNTPQMNGVVESSFVTDRSMATAMLIAANLKKKTKEVLWAEAVRHAEKLRNVSLNLSNKKECPDYMMNGKMPKMIKRPIQFGRIGFVTKRDKIRGKWKTRAQRCAMVGYAEDHSGDVYRMYNPLTQK